MELIKTALRGVGSTPRPVSPAGWERSRRPTYGSLPVTVTIKIEITKASQVVNRHFFTVNDDDIP
jgi:hypothetical protein